MAIGLLNKGNGQRRGPAKSGGASPPDELLETGNLFPEDTGLPVTVWVSPRGKARHAAGIKMCRVAGNRMVPSNTAVVGIVPEPALLEGSLPARYLTPVLGWVALNTDALLRYWRGEIGTGGLLRDLRRVDPS